MRYLFLLLSAVLLWMPLSAPAKTFYGITIPEALLEQKSREAMARHPLLAHRNQYINAIERPHTFKDRDMDFALSLGLLAFVGLFRLSRPAYFRNIFRAFRNPTLSSRQLKDQLQQDSISGLLLDLFYCFSVAFFLYQIMVYLHYDQWMKPYHPLTALGIIGGLLAGVYLLRFLFLKLSGWIFQIPEMMDAYSFHIFLINKVISILIIPFTIILSFGQGAWVQICLLIAFVMIGLILIYRYARSRFVFSHFLKFSKFHFFMYLCASEILPLAILIKLLGKWLYP